MGWLWLLRNTLDDLWCQLLIFLSLASKNILLYFLISLGGLRYLWQFFNFFLWYQAKLIRDNLKLYIIVGGIAHFIELNNFWVKRELHRVYIIAKILLQSTLKHILILDNLGCNLLILDPCPSNNRLLNMRIPGAKNPDFLGDWGSTGCYRLAAFLPGGCRDYWWTHVWCSPARWIDVGYFIFAPVNLAIGQRLSQLTLFCCEYDSTWFLSGLLSLGMVPRRFDASDSWSTLWVKKLSERYSGRLGGERSCRIHFGRDCLIGRESLVWSRCSRRQIVCSS
jgi:hypothetical protein